MIRYNSLQGKGINIRNLFILVICITALIAGYILLPKAVCGNEVCERNENCFTCKEDCKCPVGQYCSEEFKACVEPTCGNGVCELFETPDECCIDCECYGRGEICNITTNKCEVKEVKISDERVRELVIDYFSGQNKNVTSMEIIGPLVWESNIGKEVMVHIEDQAWFSLVLVTDEEKVIELPTY